MSAIDCMNHKWLKKSETPFTRDVSSNELVKDKAFDISVDSSITGFKAIDKRKIIFKRDEISKDASFEEVNLQKNKLSQDEIDYLEERNNTTRLEESKIRHK